MSVDPTLRLYECIRDGNTNGAALALANGAYIRAWTCPSTFFPYGTKKMSTLMYAVEMDQVDCVPLLLSNTFRRRPYYSRVYFKKMDILEAMQRAIELKRISILKSILFHPKNNHDDTPDNHDDNEDSVIITKNLFNAILNEDNNHNDFLSLLDDADNITLINRSNWLGMTPLHFASMYGCSKIVSFLIKAGAQVKKPILSFDHEYHSGVEIYTNLHLAVLGCSSSCNNSLDDDDDDVDVVRTLLADGGADPNALVDKIGTPLHLVLWKKKYELDTIKMLLQYGADLYIKNSHGRTPRDEIDRIIDAWHSGREKNYPMDEVLFAFWNKDELRLHLPTLLITACGRGNESLVRWLLLKAKEEDTERKITNMYSRDFFHMPLYTASREGQANIVRLLLDEGAEIDSRGSDGGCPTALSGACSKSRWDVVRLLLERGAILSDCPIYLACRRNRVQMVKFLLLEYHQNHKHSNNRNNENNNSKESDSLCLHLLLILHEGLAIAMEMNNYRLVLCLLFFDHFDDITFLLSENSNKNRPRFPATSTKDEGCRRRSEFIMSLIIKKQINIMTPTTTLGVSPLEVAVSPTTAGSLDLIFTMVSASVAVFGRLPRTA